MIRTETYVKTEIHALVIKSSAFDNNESIPEKYTCDGENLNPPIDIRNLPKATRSLVVIVDDPEAPVRPWSHWIVWNIPPTAKIKEGNIHGIEGLNDFGQRNYNGPCPTSGLHHYHYKVYALDAVLDLAQNATKHELEKSIAPHVLAFGELIGHYQRKINKQFSKN